MKKSVTYASKGMSRRKRRLFLISLYAGLALCLIIAAIAWVFLHSPLVRVDQVVISGNNAVAEQDIRDLLEAKIIGGSFLHALTGFNNMLVWPKELNASETAMFPAIASLTITTSIFTHKVSVAVTERTPVGVWCSGNDCWWFDGNGIIFKRAVEGEGSFVMTVYDASNRALGLNLKILPDQFIRGALSIITVLESGSVKAKHIDLTDLTLHELDVETYEGPKLYFSLDFPAGSGVAEALANLRAKPGFNKLAYVDFRVENKVYYK